MRNNSFLIKGELIQLFFMFPEKLQKVEIPGYCTEFFINKVRSEVRLSVINFHCRSYQYLKFLTVVLV